MESFTLTFPRTGFSVVCQGANRSLGKAFCDERICQLRLTSTTAAAHSPIILSRSRSARGHGIDTSSSALPPRVVRRVSHSGDTFSMLGGRARIESGRGATIKLHDPCAALPSQAARVLFDIAVIHNLALQGGCVTHAAGFEVGGVRVLALGESGSGKSTLAAAALASGGRVLADDTLIASRSGGNRLELVPYRRDVFLRPPSERLLGESVLARTRRVETIDGVRSVLQRDLVPEAYLARMTPDLVWAVRVDRRLRVSRLQRINQGRVLAIAVSCASALYLSPRYPLERAALLPVLETIATLCTGWELRLGRDALDSPDTTLERLRDESFA